VSSAGFRAEPLRDFSNWSSVHQRRRRAAETLVRPAEYLHPRGAELALLLHPAAEHAILQNKESRSITATSFSISPRRHLMRRLPANRPWLALARTRLLELANPNRRSSDPVSCYCQEHPGTLRVGHVLFRAERFSRLKTSTDLLVCKDSLVLIDREGTVVLEVPHARIRAVECAPATDEACRDPRLAQSEEHLFIHYEADDGHEAHLEVSVGALDDRGPVHQMCSCVRSRVGLDPADDDEAAAGA
jgi:hypothetical protein